MLRTTQNKTYRQSTTGVVDAHELENGFPTKAEDLFRYDGLIIGSVEATSFSNDQQAMIRDFADRRGGGVLFLAGRFTLSDGSYAKTPMAEMMPCGLRPGKPGAATLPRQRSRIRGKKASSRGSRKAAMRISRAG